MDQNSHPAKFPLTVPLYSITHCRTKYRSSSFSLFIFSTFSITLIESAIKNVSCTCNLGNSWVVALEIENTSGKKKNLFNLFHRLIPACLRFFSTISPQRLLKFNHWHQDHIVFNASMQIQLIIFVITLLEPPARPTLWTTTTSRPHKSFRISRVRKCVRLCARLPCR